MGFIVDPLCALPLGGRTMGSTLASTGETPFKKDVVIYDSLVSG